MKLYLNFTVILSVVLLTIKSKLENIYELKDGQIGEDRVMVVFFQGSGASKPSGNHSPMTFIGSCTNNSRHQAFFQCSFLLCQDLYSQMRQRLIFSGGILTLTLLFPLSLHTLKVPSQTKNKEMKLNKTRGCQTIGYRFFHSERIHYKSSLCASYGMLL